MAQKGTKWRMEITQQLESMRSQKEILHKQRQLENQVIGEIEQLLEERQRARNEAARLKKMTKQQQDVINVLTAEKHEQRTIIEELSLQLENVIDKLKEYKAEASQERDQLIQATAYHEKETLRKQYLQTKTEQCKLVQYFPTQSSHQEHLEQNKQRQDLIDRAVSEGLLNLIKKNKKILLEANQAKEEMKKIMTDMNQELKRNKECLMQQRSIVKHMKHSVNVSINKMRQRWTEIQGHVQMQDIPVEQFESRIKEKGGTTKFYTADMKLFTILEEKKKLWEELESITDQQYAGMEHSDTQREIKYDTEYGVREDSMEANSENEVSTGMKRVILEVEGIRKMLRRVREDSEQSKREITEEKNQIKWMNFSAKKQSRVLDHQLERIIKERDELDLLKMKIQHQKQEAEKKLQDAFNACVRIAEIKSAMQKAAAEIHHTGEEMITAQSLMKESSHQAKELMVSRCFVFNHTYLVYYRYGHRSFCTRYKLLHK